MGGGVLGGWRGRALQRYLGPDPHLGVLEFCGCTDNPEMLKVLPPHLARDLH